MFNRRIFFKSLLMGMVSVPVIAKATQPEPIPALEDAPYSESAHNDAGLSHWELKGIKATMMEYLDTADIRWGIPGNKDNAQGVLLYNSIVVTFKHSNLHRRLNNTVYIEVERAS